MTKNKISELSKNRNEKQKNVSNFLVEKINLIFEVKKNNKELVEQKESQSFLFEEEKAVLKKFYFNLKIDTLKTLLYTITISGNLLLSIYFYKNGVLSIGDVAALNLYTMFLVWNYSDLSETFSKFVDVLTVVGDAEKLLQETTENYEQGKISKKVEGEIEFKNVDFEYDQEEKKENEKESKKKFSLSGINLKIQKGEKVAFVGESGGGKSTSIELVGGFYFPKKGDVWVDGISTKKINLNDLRSSMAYVSQDIAIFNSTIGENISYGLSKDIKNKKEKKEKIKKAAELANISEFIEKLPDGYDTKVGEKGLKLSDGQKQRVAIARAILRDPKILILDEPTSALDIKSEIHITNSLKSLMEGRTTIIIAHRISTVCDADKIFVFKEGRIIEEGNYKELISKKGEFQKMVEMHRGLE